MIVPFLFACTAPDATAPAPGGEAGQREVRPWTVAVFMNGDNDLETYVPHDLNELEAGDPGDSAWVVVQADRIDGYDDSDGDWTGTRRYAIVPDDDEDAVTSPPVAELGEVDMGDPAALADFLAWTRATYPSERLMLALWNHGDGWLLTARAPAGISYDDTSGTVIGVANGGLADGLSAQVDAVGPVDVLAFDGCNMGAWEVIYALRGLAEVASVSQSWVGAEGLDYTNLLDTLGANPDIATPDLGVVTAEDAVTRGGERTWSAVDVGAIDEVAAAIDAFAVHLRASDAPVQAFQNLRRETATTDGAWHDWYLDLGDLAAVAETKPGMGDAATPVATALDAAVLAAYGSDRYAWTSGLTIFAATDDAGYLNDYAGGPWAAATTWDELLQEVREAEAGI